MSRSEAEAAWRALEPPWRRCFELAWEAYAARTIPVGAVLAGPEGEIVGEGRNRVFDRAAAAGEVAGSLLAHAEVNALVGLDPEQRYERHVLYTSLEPCLLCVGATVMATVGRIRYAGADPYGGSDGGLIGVNPHIERVPLAFEGPRRDTFGLLGTALLLAFFLVRRPEGVVVATLRERLPAALPAAEALVARGALEAAAGGASLLDVLPEVWSSLG